MIAKEQKLTSTIKDFIFKIDNQESECVYWHILPKYIYMDIDPKTKYYRFNLKTDGFDCIDAMDHLINLFNQNQIFTLIIKTIEERHPNYHKYMREHYPEYIDVPNRFYKTYEKLIHAKEYEYIIRNIDYTFLQDENNMEGIVTITVICELNNISKFYDSEEMENIKNDICPKYETYVKKERY